MPTQASSLWPREFSRRSRRSPREGSEGTKDLEHQTSTVPASSFASATPSKSGAISSITDENASWSSKNFKPESLICDFCTNPEGKDDNYLSWLEKVPQLGECPNCAMMRNAKLALEAFSHQEIWHISLPTLVEDGLSFHATGGVSGTETYEIYASDSLPPLPYPLNKIRLKQHISGHTTLEQSLSWVQQKLQNCLTQHTSCLYQEEALLPTRILDLGPSGALDDYTGDITLHQTSNERSSYFCLSYCWGGSQPLCTTRSTLREHQRGILWHSLPKTYQDAITFTRRMGVRFLWIDSLCIIQDDDEDWQKEAASMSTIYQNSTLVLAAAISRNPYGGCISNIPSYAWRSQLPLKVGHHSLQVYLRKRIRHPEEYTHIFEPLQLPVALLKRGWVFQERILAPRTLHFLYDELVWECAENVICECSNSAVALKISKKYIHNKIPEGSAIILWREWISEYSALDLTFPSDRLPAISGLAHRLNLALRGALGDYLAGIWRNTLLSDLLWQLNDSRFDRRRRRLYKKRSPTWSWVSVGRKVKFQRFDFQSPGRSDVIPECIIIDAHCVPVGSDPFGQISSGCLTLSGMLIEVNLLFQTSDFSYLLGNLKGDVLRSTVSTFLDTALEYTGDWSQIHVDLRLHVDLMYCFVIGVDDLFRYSLLLRSVNAQEHTYERIGLVMASLGSWSDMFEPLQSGVTVKII